MMDNEVFMGTMPGAYNYANYQDITFCVTEECNLRCRYCYMVHKSSFKTLSFETAKEIVEYILHMQIERDAVVFNFIGGEPTLEMDLIDKITDYLKIRMYQLDHPWHRNHMFYIGTNGVLYGSEKVQRYIRKNANRVQFAITIDGTKQKHDLQRVHKDGSGSYDEVASIIPLWQKQFPDQNFTKVTFASDDLPLLKDSIIHLWSMGIKQIAANVVFENVWKEGDEEIYEEQLRALADYVIENRLWNTYSVRFFDPAIGFQLSKKDREKNYCGSGTMIAFDTEGKIYPCIRFLDFCLSSQNGTGNMCFGNVRSGIDKNKKKVFETLSIGALDNPECDTCEIASGCATCAGMNYDDSGRKTVYHRSTYICRMQKAHIRANKYFWDQYSVVTGSVSPWEKNRLRKYRSENWSLPGLKYLYILLADDAPAYCNYHARGEKIMGRRELQKALQYADYHNMVPVFVGDESSISWGNFRHIAIHMSEDGQRENCSELEQHIRIIDDPKRLLDLHNEKTALCTLDSTNISSYSAVVQKLSVMNVRFLNFVKRDISLWSSETLIEYETFLEIVIECSMRSGFRTNISIRNDNQSRRDCRAGVESYTVAPNGKIYPCPAFYYDDPASFLCEVGEEIPDLREYHTEYYPKCSKCQYNNCRRCVFENYKMSGDICVPSARQCEISNMESRIVNEE